MSAFDAAAVSARLPAGYRARPFEERDRETMVAIRNAQVPEIEHGDAEEWREWERMAPDDSQVRFTVEAADGSYAGSGSLGRGGFMRMADGAVFGGVGVAPEHRRRGIGGTVLEVLEGLARAMGAPRFLADASDRWPESVAWARKRGYRELGRRIESYAALAGFDPAAHAARVERVVAQGLRLETFAEALARRDEDGREAFWRALWEAEAPMWEDVPWPTPRPHWSYEELRRMAVDSGKLLADASILAWDGDVIAGFTTAGAKGRLDGYTWMTGVSRAHRGRGVAHALKVESLARAKAAGRRAMFTTNDEPNRAMRGVNAALGYEMLPASVQLEKTLA